MERKTIGSFIAVLRRASGMTQRELAERLSVSDKTVSHWERDESLPDLTLIPVLAEIFGVSCDEILRGERINEARRPASPDADGPAPPSEKALRQIRNHINRTKTRLRTQSIIAIGLSAAGLIAALICNFGFNRAYNGFFIACVFYVAALLCQSAFLTLALSAVGEEFCGSNVGEFRRHAVRLTMAVMTLTLALLAFTLPLIILPGDPYFGLLAEPLFKHGLPAAAGTIALSLLACYIIKRALTGRGIIGAPPERDEKSLANRRLAKKLLIIFGIILAVIFNAQLIFNSFSYYPYLRGREFYSFEEFKEYIETPTDYTELPLGISFEIFPNEDDPEKNDGYTEFDPDRMILSRGTDIYTDPDGVEHEWSHYNMQVVSIKWAMPITTYTAQDINNARLIQDSLNIAFIIPYIAVTAAGILVYTKKRVR